MSVVNLNDFISTSNLLRFMYVCVHCTHTHKGGVRSALCGYFCVYYVNMIVCVNVPRSLAAAAATLIDPVYSMVYFQAKCK